MKFVSIDVETANSDMASICQIGAAIVRDGVIAEEWTSYIDPEDRFDRVNVSIHGIDSERVSGAPTFLEIYEHLYSFLNDEIVICHSHFDRTAIRQTATKYGIGEPNSRWLDTVRVARRTWTSCANKGYGLRSVCAMLGYDFQHHDALEDARAAAMIMLAACKKTSIPVEDWISRVKQPLSPTRSSSGKRQDRVGNPDGVFYGEAIVFTGKLQIPRREAAEIAATAGFRVANSVTTKTSVLVVGDKDLRRHPGDKLSSKQRKAEDFVAKGYPIRILKESDFREMMKLSGQDL